MFGIPNICVMLWRVNSSLILLSRASRESRNMKDIEKTAPEHDKDNDEHGPKLQFEHVASVQEVKFRVSWSDTLQDAWDTAYVKLNEQKRPDDRLQTDDGQDMMSFLGLTLRQLFDEKKTKSRKFQIVGPTGGAATWR